MRTTITIRAELLAEAQKVSGKSGYSEAIATSLRDSVALRKRLELLEDLFSHKTSHSYGGCRRSGANVNGPRRHEYLDRSLPRTGEPDRTENVDAGGVEFLSGFRDRSTQEQYELAASLLAEHPRLGAGDAIIAATAMTCGAALWTVDRDFDKLRDRGLRLFQ